MKSYLIILLVFIFSVLSVHSQTNLSSPNIFIITTDGFRWQEVFKGADSLLIRDNKFVQDSNLVMQQYWDESEEKRRKLLLPFFWNVITKQGQLLGNRAQNSKMNVANFYKISYPGYSEIFTGFADSKLIPNLALSNKNKNVLEFLNEQDEYKGKVVAFTSWNILPFILNESNNKLPVNGGYEALDENEDTINILINQVQKSVLKKQHTRFDLLTYSSAKTYIEQNHPKVMFLGLGETDEFAHKGQYDRYLQKAHQVDEMIAELWYNVQTDTFYKNNTIFIITTDHGRGSKSRNWNSHGFWVKGSGETWMAIIGKGIKPSNDVNEKKQIYQNQIAATIANLLGEEFVSSNPIGKPISFGVSEKNSNKK